MYLIEISQTNETKHYCIYDDSWKEEEKPEFLALQKEYGACKSKVYVTEKVPVLNYPQINYQVGWYFEKKMQYEDCKEYYIQGTWITYKETC